MVIFNKSLWILYTIFTYFHDINIISFYCSVTVSILSSGRVVVTIHPDWATAPNPVNISSKNNKHFFFMIIIYFIGYELDIHSFCKVYNTFRHCKYTKKNELSTKNFLCK